MIYVFIGADSAYLKLQIQKNFMQTKVALDDTEFISFSGYDDLIQDVVADCASPSFTANKKIIVMDKCYFLAKTKERTPLGNEQYLPALKEYILHPDPINDLYLLVNDALIKNEVTDLLNQKCRIKKYANPDDAELSRMAIDYYRMRSLKIDDNAVKELIKRVKGNYSQLVQELAKLENVDGKITVQVVDSLVHLPLEDNIFNLTTFMLQGSLSSAMHLYYDLLNGGNDAYKLLAVIAAQIRFMAAVSFGLSRHETEKQMAEELEAKPFRVTMTKRLVGNRKPSLFYHLLAQLFDLDRHFKLSNENLARALELFIIKNTSKTLVA